MIVGFIGIGKVGKLLSSLISATGVSVLADSTKSAQEIADNSNIIFITTPEHSIENIANSIKWTPNTSVVHCSGLTSIDALRSAKAQGCSIGVFHPLHNFNKTNIVGASISIEADDHLYDQLCSLATAIGCNYFRLYKSRELYHSAIPFVNNFETVLIDHSIKIWTSIGIDIDVARSALIHLANVRDELPTFDQHQFQKHFKALKEFDDELVDLYRQLTISSLQKIKNRN